MTYTTAFNTDVAPFSLKGQLGALDIALVHSQELLDTSHSSSVAGMVWERR